MKSKRNQMTLRLPAELDKRISQAAAQMGISKTAYITMLLNEKIVA